MVEQDHHELTKEETELYDRQIRLWGLENQKK
jgi:molybdopterin/thiamine biosynthesis adenylyltransferase